MNIKYIKETYMNNLRQVISRLTAPKVADLCGVSVRAVYKWRKSNALPRTEYTGETKYADVLAQAIGNVSAEQIRDFSNPARSTD